MSRVTVTPIQALELAAERLELDMCEFPPGRNRWQVWQREHCEAIRVIRELKARIKQNERYSVPRS